MTSSNLLATGLLLATLSLLSLTSCDRKEKVLDVNTPDGGIEVERNKRTGEISVEVE